MKRQEDTKLFPDHGTDDTNICRRLTFASISRRVASNPPTPTVRGLPGCSPARRPTSDSAFYARQGGSNDWPHAVDRLWYQTVPRRPRADLLRSNHHTAPGRLRRANFPTPSTARPPIWALQQEFREAANRVPSSQSRAGPSRDRTDRTPSAQNSQASGGQQYISPQTNSAPALHVTKPSEQVKSQGSFSAPRDSLMRRKTGSGPSRFTANSGVITDRVDSISLSGSNDMAAGFPMQSGDARRHNSATHRNGRFENQRPMSSQLCRNGPQCRKFQEGEPCNS